MIPHVRNESHAGLGMCTGISYPGVSGHRNGMFLTDISATINIEDDQNFLSSPKNDLIAQGDDIPMVDFSNNLPNN
jgi:hypothetical protein